MPVIDVVDDSASAGKGAPIFRFPEQIPERSDTEDAGEEVVERRATREGQKEEDIDRE